MWTSQGLNLGPPDYESVAFIINSFVIAYELCHIQYQKVYTFDFY